MYSGLEKRKRVRKDCFNSFLVENAHYAGNEEIPCVKTSNLLPEKVITFSKSLSTKETEAWIHFYEYDERFERLWRQPFRYLPIIKKFKGIISPDYSLYYDMPLCMQKWNIYRGRALAHWLNENDIEVIPNIRWGDERTFELATLGVEQYKTIAVGTYGCIKKLKSKNNFLNGLNYAINKLKPKNIIIYGSVPKELLILLEKNEIKLIRFESEFAQAHKKGVA